MVDQISFLAHTFIKVFIISYCVQIFCPPVNDTGDRVLSKPFHCCIHRSWTTQRPSESTRFPSRADRHSGRCPGKQQDKKAEKMTVNLDHAGQRPSGRSTTTTSTQIRVDHLQRSDIPIRQPSRSGDQPAQASPVNAPNVRQPYEGPRNLHHPRHGPTIDLGT